MNDAIIAYQALESIVKNEMRESAVSQGFFGRLRVDPHKVFVSRPEFSRAICVLQEPEA